MGMHRDQARKAAGRARIAAAGLAVVGGAVLFVPFPKLGAAPASEPRVPIEPVKPPLGPKTAAPFDVDAATGILAKVGPDARPAAPIEPPPETVASGETTPEGGPLPPDEPPVTVGPELRYLGPIVGPRRTLAMVALDGQQRVVAVGEKVEGKTVVEVTPAQIVLHDDTGVEHVITMAERVLDWSMEPPAPRGYGSKKMPGAASKAGASGDHADPHEAEAAAIDVELKRQMEARRLAEQERGGVEDHPNTPSAPPRTGRPTAPAAGASKAPANVRGSTPASPPRIPPTRPAVPTKGKLDEKKAGNQV